MDALSALENVKDENDEVGLTKAGVLSVEPDTSKLQGLVKRAVEAKQWIPKFKAFLRYHDWASSNDLTFAHLSRVTPLEWAVFEFNPFCVAQHMLWLVDEKRVNKRVPWIGQYDKDWDVKIFQRCVTRLGRDVEWNDTAYARYAAVLLVLHNSEETFVKASEVKRRLRNDYSIAWDASEDFLRYDPSEGLLGNHPLYRESALGTRDYTVFYARDSWLVPGDEKMTLRHLEEFKRLQNQIVREDIKEDGAICVTYALKEKALYLKRIADL